MFVKRRDVSFEKRNPRLFEEGMRQLAPSVENKEADESQKSVTEAIKAIVEQQMREDETSALQLHRLLRSKGH